MNYILNDSFISVFFYSAKTKRKINVRAILHLNSQIIYTKIDIYIKEKNKILRLKG